MLIQKNPNSISRLFIDDENNKRYVVIKSPKSYDFVKNFLIENLEFNKDNEKFLRDFYDNIYCNSIEKYKNTKKKTFSTIFGIKFNKRFIEYWTSRGYSQDEAKYKSNIIKNEDYQKKYKVNYEDAQINRDEKQRKTSLAKEISDLLVEYRNNKNNYQKPSDFQIKKFLFSLYYPQKCPSNGESSERWLFIDHKNWNYKIEPYDFNTWFDWVVKYQKMNGDNVEYLKKIYDEKYIPLFKGFKYYWITPRFKFNKLYGFETILTRLKYWTDRGWTKEYGQMQIAKRQNTISKESFIRKYGEKKGIERLEAYTNNKSYIMKEFYKIHEAKLPYSKTIDPDTGEFYTKEKIQILNKINLDKGRQKHIKNLKEKKVFTIWQKEYWINKGFSEEEAKNIIYSKMNHNNLKFLISKYGETEGSRRFNKRQEKYKQTCKNKSPEEMREWNIKKVSKQPQRVSKSSIKFFDECLNRLQKEGIKFKKVYYNENEWDFWDYETKRIYFYDFCIPEIKILIEYNGIMYHPKYWMMPEEELKLWNSPYKVNGITQRDIDIRKETLAKERGFRFLTIWEDEEIESSYTKAINFIKESII